MVNWVKRYWAELVVFGAIFGVLLLCCTPDYTWINTDCDGIHYTYSAKYLYPAHKTSAPLFLLLGNLFIKVPIGTEAWRFAMMSVLASTVSAVFIYLIIKQKLLPQDDNWYTSYTKAYKDKVSNKNRIYAIIGALVFGGSALVISQSTIIETYALVTMLGLGAYYFAIKKQWLWCAVMLGAGGAVHHLIAIPALVLFIAYKSLRKWRYVGVMFAFLLFYAYIPLTTMINDPPNMWGNVTASSFLADNASTALMLIGGLSIWDFPKRILDTFGIVGISLGLAVVPIIYYLVKHRRHVWYKEPLLWLTLLPILYFMVDLAPQTYVYVMPAIGFGAVIAGIGLAKMKRQWSVVVLVMALVLMVYNAIYFDIGRTLDKDLEASVYYREELDKIPDGDILVAQQGWEWAAVYPYNKEYDRNIIPVCVGTLPSKIYQESIIGQGVMLEDDENVNLGDRATYIAKSILANNDNVWITIPTNSRAYGAEVLQADGNEALLDWSPRTITNGSGDMIWQWRPSNPYDFITGAIEVDEWRDIIFSNYSILTIFMMATIGFVPVWIGYQIVVKKKKWRLHKNESTK